MQLRLEPVRTRRLSLTPLVDVIFLLLLFFMLSSTFLRYGQVQFDAGSAGGQTLEQPDVLIAVTSNGIRINGAPAAAVSNAVVSLAELEDNGAQTAVIQTYEDASSQDLILFLEAIRTRSSLSYTLVR